MGLVFTRNTVPSLIPSESHWNPETQKLSIDLNPSLGKSVTLILSGWHSQHGISWHNEFRTQPVASIDTSTDSQLIIEF
ncbi:MAG TPA: hypothetical protein DCZ48_12460 [Methylococcaceae bacterium]|nr:hypothetical protein [Methylococcaceae bacterium]